MIIIVITKYIESFLLDAEKEALLEHSTKDQARIFDFKGGGGERLIMLYGERIMAGLLRAEMDENRRQKYIYASESSLQDAQWERKKFFGLIRQKSNSLRLNPKLWKTILFYNSLNTQNTLFFCWTLQTRHFRINFHENSYFTTFVHSFVLNIKISIAKATHRKIRWIEICFFFRFMQFVCVLLRPLIPSTRYDVAMKTCLFSLDTVEKIL